MTYISSVRSYALGRRHTGAMSVGVWVVFDSQESDAQMLMRNNKHKVKEPLSAVEIERIEKGLSRHNSSVNHVIIKYVFVLIGVFGALAYFLYGL
ncbi:hypothetical protein VST7929_02927 [Vibrio stylophorae]|uniref:Uncharacterized protein n=1 Tax=Vibrio stylophorae TaxID=659351 RepID=A0ABM8ZX71_9VIBR|nr:hypothetical protein VST7929_02927 [Vibrio stylophorae]